MARRGIPFSLFVPSISLVISGAVPLLMFETADHIFVIEHRGHTCRCFATPTYPLDRFLGLASKAFASHCFAIQSQRDDKR